MTTPNLTDTMPYGVVMRPAALANGNSYLFRPVKPHPKLNDFNLRLTPGPVMITASWTGEQSCSLYLRRDGKLNEIAVMPQRSGGGARWTPPIKLGAIDGDEIYLYMRPAYTDTGLSPTATMEVIPLTQP